MTALKKHRITEVKTMRVRSRYPRTIAKNARIGMHGDGPNSQIRVITTDGGASGWGISWTPSENTPDVVGKLVSELFDPKVGVIAEEAVWLDFPLHDLAGVILNQPVYQMLGAKGETAVPCYDGAIYMDDLIPEDAPRGIEAILENCRNDYVMGYRAFKLKIGRGYQWMEFEEGLKRDVEVTRTVRENFPDCQILVDANDGYDCDGFLRYFDAVADCRIFWIEEPFREDCDDLARLRELLEKRSPETLVADGESRPDVEFLFELAHQKLLDVLLMDIAGFGFTAWRRLMPKVIEAGVYASPHTWGGPLKTHYAAQIAAGLGHVVTVEGIPGTTEQVDRSLYKLEEGLLHVPEEPGFGMKLM